MTVTGCSPTVARWQLASAKLLAADRWRAITPWPPTDTLKLVNRCPLMTDQLLFCSQRLLADGRSPAAGRRPLDGVPWRLAAFPLLAACRRSTVGPWPAAGHRKLAAVPCRYLLQLLVVRLLASAYPASFKMGIGSLCRM